MDAPAKKRRTRIQTEKRELILEAALEVFSTHGFRGSTIDQIAEAAGMSKPNLLYYFRRKEDIHEALIQRLTGAAKVVSFGPMIRTNASGAHGHNQPAFGAHVDYGARTVADFTRDLLPAEEAERRLQGWHMLINVWRPITMVESAPLALCDASTVRREDLFDSEVVGGLGDFKRRSLWGFNLAYDPGHRWYWVPHMQPWEAMAFKLFDSDPDAIQHTAHSAFEDPNTPLDAAPRQSVEVRTIAYLDG